MVDHEPITQPVDGGRLQFNRAVHSLVTEHDVPLTEAVNLCCRLEQLRARCWPLRYGAVVDATPIRVRAVKQWLLAHGYLSQDELDASERAA